jgi:hypothetical protein
VIRFNEQGPEGLINIASPGAPAKLNEQHHVSRPHRGREADACGRWPHSIWNQIFYRRARRRTGDGRPIPSHLRVNLDRAAGL